MGLLSDWLVNGFVVKWLNTCIDCVKFSAITVQFLLLWSRGYLITIVLSTVSLCTNNLCINAHPHHQNCFLRLPSRVTNTAWFPWPSNRMSNVSLKFEPFESAAFLYEFCHYDCQVRLSFSISWDRCCLIQIISWEDHFLKAFPPMFVEHVFVSKHKYNTAFGKCERE